MATPLTLTGKQKRHLRALGHHLDPLVQLGKSGLTSGAVRAIDAALGQHELVKVRLGTECPDELDDVSLRVAADVAATIAQTMGRTMLLYRRHPKKPVITLPAADGAEGPSKAAKKPGKQSPKKSGA